MVPSLHLRADDINMGQFFVYVYGNATPQNLVTVNLLWIREFSELEIGRKSLGTSSSPKQKQAEVEVIDGHVTSMQKANTDHVTSIRRGNSDHVMSERKAVVYTLMDHCPPRPQYLPQYRAHCYYYCEDTIICTERQVIEGKAKRVCWANLHLIGK